MSFLIESYKEEIFTNDISLEHFNIMLEYHNTTSSLYNYCQLAMEATDDQKKKSIMEKVSSILKQDQKLTDKFKAVSKEFKGRFDDPKYQEECDLIIAGKIKLMSILKLLLPSIIALGLLGLGALFAPTVMAIAAIGFMVLQIVMSYREATKRIPHAKKILEMLIDTKKQVDGRLSKMDSSSEQYKKLSKVSDKLDAKITITKDRIKSMEKLAFRRSENN